jgi:asparagine synthase (glutamine-hydrolysing)
MKTGNETAVTDRVNSYSRYKEIFNLKLIFPGDSKIRAENGSLHIKVERKNKEVKTDILEELTSNIKNSRPDSVLVSGGIDSSVLAAIAIREFKNVKLISAGTENGEDLNFAEILSRELATPLIRVNIDEEGVYRAINGLKTLGIDTYNTIMGITEFLSIEKAVELGCRRIISGIGSDELFFGFYKHKKMDREKLREFRDERLFYMPAFDLWRLNSIAVKFGISMIFPYLTDNVIDIALSGGVEFSESNDKVLLRSAGKRLGLSKTITERNKKAMQYGSGVVKLLRDLSRKKEYKNVGEFIKGI